MLCQCKEGYADCQMKATQEDLLCDLCAGRADNTSCKELMRMEGEISAQ
jgi:hypothetical protein